MSGIPYTLFGQEGWSEEDLDTLRLDAKFTLKRNLAKGNSVAQIRATIEGANDPQWKKDLYLKELDKILFMKKLMWGGAIVGAGSILFLKKPKFR